MESRAYVQPVFMGRCDVCNVEGQVTNEYFAGVWAANHNAAHHPPQPTSH